MGLPIFGTSNYTDPRWTPDPNTRGTWGLNTDLRGYAGIVRVQRSSPQRLSPQVRMVDAMVD